MTVFELTFVRILFGIEIKEELFQELLCVIKFLVTLAIDFFRKSNRLIAFESWFSFTVVISYPGPARPRVHNELYWLIARTYKY